MSRRAGHVRPAKVPRSGGATGGDVTLQAFDVRKLQLADHAVADQRLDVPLDPAAVAGKGGDGEALPDRVTLSRWVRVSGAVAFVPQSASR